MYALTLKVTQALHQDHLVTLALLERLEALFKKYPAKRTPPADATDVSAVLDDAVRVLEEEVGRHFAFEEEHLFPRFTEFAGPGIPMMLRDEHEAIRGLAGALIDLARTASEGGFTADTWAGSARSPNRACATSSPSRPRTVAASRSSRGDAAKSNRRSSSVWPTMARRSDGSR